MRPFWSPGGSLWEPFWSKSVRPLLTETTFRPLKINKKTQKVLPKSILAFFAFLFFRLFFGNYKKTEKIQISIFAIPSLTFAMFWVPQGGLGDPLGAPSGPPGPPRGSLEPPGCPKWPPGCPKGPPREPPGLKKEPFWHPRSPFRCPKCPRPSPHRPTNHPTTQPRSLQNRAGGMRGAIE